MNSILWPALNYKKDPKITSLLYILISIWVLPTPITSQNLLFILFTRFWCKNDEILGDLWLRLKKLIFLSFLHPCKNVWKMLIFWHFLHPCKNFWKMQISTCIWSMQHPKAGQIIQHHLKNKLRVNYLLTVAYRGLP